MGYFDDFSDPAMKELVESVGLIHEEVDEAREVPMNFHVKLLNRGINAKPGKTQGPPRGMAKFDIMHGDSDPSKGEPLERKRRGAFFDIHAPGSGERAGDRVRSQYSGGAAAGQAASTSHLTGRPVGATPDQLAGLEKTRATIMKIGREMRGESVGDYGLGDLNEASKCAGCGEHFPCSDSKRTDISGRERAKHYVGPMAHERGTVDAGNKQGASSFGGAMAQASRERGLVPDARGIVSLGKVKESLDEGRDSHPAGMRVRVSHGSGVHSNKTGTIQPWSSVKTDGRGIPELAGEYHPMSDKRRRDERPVKLDNGETITMFKNRLSQHNESIDEGHGAIAHHYYYARHGNGVNSASAGAQGSSDGGAQPTVGRRNEQMSRVEASWAAKRAADIYDIRNRHFAHGTVQEQTFRVGQVVESQTGIITTSGRLGVGAKGTVKLIGEDRSVTVEFRAPIGEQKFAPDVMSAYFAPIKTESMRSIIRKAITEPPVTVEDHPSPGDRVVCENGFQYAVERRDSMGRMIQVTDHLGRSHMFNAGQIKKLPEDSGLVRGVVGHQLSENLQSVPLNPGQKVTVATIDPIYNQWRVFPVYAGEADGFLGATGMVEFAMYPVSSGTRMYRVLFEKGGRRDFSEAELTNAHEAGTVGIG